MSLDREKNYVGAQVNTRVRMYIRGMDACIQHECIERTPLHIPILYTYMHICRGVDKILRHSLHALLGIMGYRISSSKISVRLCKIQIFTKMISSKKELCEREMMPLTRPVGRGPTVIL